MRRLTTTSYAILGWLDVRPWSTYELARQMTRNLRFFWPRATSRLFDEPKNLIAHGLASADTELVGRRPRTVYTITPAGRDALRAWHAGASTEPSLDFEGLVHLYFGAAATPAQLLAAVESAGRLADAIQEQGTRVAGEFLTGRYAFPERAHFSGFVFDFLWNYAELLRAWAVRSEAEIAAWRDTAPTDAKRDYAFAVFRAALDSRPSTPLAPWEKGKG
ncbi:MAG TPA: PadR family transcriptional regulator [Dehalococcoidia bacterium]